MIRSLLVGPLLVVAAGCCRQPTVAPGGAGIFARYLPPDPAVPGGAADSRSGEIAPSDRGWPPTPVANDCTGGRDELGDFEAALGVHDSDACPTLQDASVPAVTVTPGSATPGSPHPLGHNRYCFVQGKALVVVETTERLSPRCRHVVSVAVYPKGGGS